MYISRSRLYCAVWLCVQSAQCRQDKDTHNEMTNNYCHEMAFWEMWKEARTNEYDFSKLKHTSHTQNVREIPKKERGEKAATSAKTHGSQERARECVAASMQQRMRRMEAQSATQMHFIYQAANREREGCTWTSGKHQPTPRILSYYYYFSELWRSYVRILSFFLSLPQFFSHFISFRFARSLFFIHLVYCTSSLANNICLFYSMVCACIRRISSAWH